MKIQANGITMNYELTGSGKCLTLIHGIGFNLNAWSNQVPAWSQYYRVPTYDIRGHGQTEFPEGELSTELWIDDLYAILKALDIEETYLLGHSMAGGIAARFALAHPGMVKALILSSGLGLIPGGGGERSEEERLRATANRQAQLEAIKKEGMTAVSRGRFQGMFSPGFADRNPAAVERYKAVMLQNDPEKYLQVMQRMGNPGASPDLGRISCSVLIIAGEYDSAGITVAKAVHQAVPGSHSGYSRRGRFPPSRRRMSTMKPCWHSSLA
ncbi:MAG: alpha/beta fold hydrolase [Chloroflexi bacterium]|nr:alpha/beta fold hydrolase [Chloroflexota bacterium]